MAMSVLSEALRVIAAGGAGFYVGDVWYSESGPFHAIFRRGHFPPGRKFDKAAYMAEIGRDLVGTAIATLLLAVLINMYIRGGRLSFLQKAGMVLKLWLMSACLDMPTRLFGRHDLVSTASDQGYKFAVIAVTTVALCLGRFRRRRVMEESPEPPRLRHQRRRVIRAEEKKTVGKEKTAENEKTTETEKTGGTPEVITLDAAELSLSAVSVPLDAFTQLHDKAE